MRFCLELILAAMVSGTLAGASLPASGALPNSGAVWVVKVDTRTGKLVRSLVAVNNPGATQPGANTAQGVRSLVAEAARNFDVNPLLVESVIQVESNYNPFAVSPKGAQG